MFDEATLLARLQNGEDAQKIADEMAASLNKVNKLYTDQLKKEEEAKRLEKEAKKKASEVQKKNDLQDILDVLANWFATYYNVEDEIWEEINADTVLDLIDSIQEYVEALDGLKSIFSIKTPSHKTTIKAEKPKKVSVEKNANDILDAFLAEMGW